MPTGNPPENAFSNAIVTKNDREASRLHRSIVREGETTRIIEDIERRLVEMDISDVKEVYQVAMQSCGGDPALAAAVLPLYEAYLMNKQRKIMNRSIGYGLLF
ncbi:hypothetical protein [Rathayibacter sp. AY1C1]|uniref:hypothetical protein n=1 Tax=Rathayibacter sp. AY1C1 TaxID=2080534 RepID=UPI0011B0834A|nr:hypothetical protein [Rathayibacter sp. AY1C1]